LDFSIFCHTVAPTVSAALMGRKGRANPTGRPAPADLRSVRRLQRMGPVSLGVSVPRRWVGDQGLRVGSPVDLQVAPDGSIRVRPNPGAAPNERTVRVEVDARLRPEHLFRRLLGAYLAGAVAFEIHEPGALSPVTQGVVRTFTRRTIQPEVLSEENETIRLRDVSDASPVPLPKLVGRMGQLVLGLHRDAAASWRDLPLGVRPSWDQRDDEVDRQAWFIERSAVRMLEGDGPEDPDSSAGVGPLGWWTVARSLERIADHGVRLGEIGVGLAEGSLPAHYLTSLEQLHEQSLQHLEAVLEALRAGGIERANELLDTGEALRATARTYSERLFPTVGAAATIPPSAAIALGQILESIGRTTAYAQDIAQVALDRALPRAASPGPVLSPPAGSPEPYPATPEPSEERKNPGGKRRK
jgi:phosphate uptake regulator